MRSLLCALAVCSGVCPALEFAGISPAVAGDTLRIAPGSRVFVLAPHPDDEVICAAGLIQQALAEGDSTWVAFLTSGDAPWDCAAQLSGNLFPRAHDFLELGRTRMAEARSAGAVLGPSPDQLLFLGYPDAGLSPLLHEYWEDTLKSPTTRARSDPYSASGRAYNGSGLLAELSLLLQRLRPDLLVAPHQLDAHPDHRATAGFVELARAAWDHRDSGRFPLVLSYLVHHPGYPRVDSGLRLLPPAPHAGGDDWYSLPLTQRELETKAAALNHHQTQIATVGSYLERFLANSELFSTGVADSGPVAEDAPRLSLVAEARVDTLSVICTDSAIRVRLLLRAEPLDELTYSVFVQVLTRDADSLVLHGLIIDLPPQGRNRPDVTIVAGPADRNLTRLSRVRRIDFGWEVSLPCALLPDSGLLFYSGEVGMGSATLNHTAIGRLSIRR